jgi:ribosomal protein L12E/L44/L45/RPP1/RPP2
MEPVRRKDQIEAQAGAGITRAQVAKIWACARDLGLDREMLYLLVPRGSISALSHREASELIEHLVELGARRVAPAQPKAADASDPNAATQEQRNFIHFLFGRVGWIGSPARVRGFLRKFAGVDAVEAIRDRKRASAIIEALKAIHQRQKNAKSA